jgi:hypothetical protein
MPPGAVYVGRSSRWGNPWRVTEEVPAKEAVARYRAWLDGLSPTERDALLAPLRGRDLACWCRPGQTCHAEVLLTMANERAP